MQLLWSQGKAWNQEHTSSKSRKQTVRIRYVLLKKNIKSLSHSWFLRLYLRFLSIWHWESCYFQMHNVLWTCKQTKQCRYIKTQARKGPSATANFFLLSSHVQPCSRLWTHTCTALLSCVSFSSLLSLPSTVQAALSCPDQTSATLGNPRAFPAPQEHQKHTKVIMQIFL